MKKYILECMGNKLELTMQDGETTKETILREFGWLLTPIMEGKNMPYDEVLNKLKWKVLEAK